VTKNILIILFLAFALNGNSQKIQHFSLKELPSKSVNELLTRGMISGEKGTIGYFTYKKGAVVPMHQHSNEQYSLITQGSVKVLIEGREVIVKAGEGIIIPPNVPHSFVSLEDNTIDIDFFSPSRMDWITGSDNYYNDSSQKEPAKWTGEVLTPEIFASLDEAAGNIAFTPQGDLIHSLHPFFNPEIRVKKYDAKTKKSVPFPNLEWNTPRAADDHFLSNVLGIRSDENGIIWMLDMGQRNAVTPKIVGWNTRFNRLERIYYLPQIISKKHTQSNDFVVDTKHGFFIIADEGIGNGGDGSTASLLTVDMNTGITKRILEGHRTTLPENIPIKVDGKILTTGKNNLLVGCDGITADKDFEWLYYSPLNGTKIYRIKIQDLINEQYTDTDLNSKIETYSAKPNNGGLSIDIAGNLYLTAVESHSVSIVLAADRSVHTLASDEKMLWPDGVSYNAADGFMYVSAAQVHLGAAFNNGKNEAGAPFYIFRFLPLSNGVSNR